MFGGVLRHVRRQPVAFVALFFALGGGALAATKAITVGSPASGDLTGTYPNPTVAHVLGGQTPITTSTSAGGDLAGTYPNPTIADGKVTTGKFANGAVAPDAAGVDQLFGDGHDGDATIAIDTPLTRDMYYRNLTVAPGATLNPGGYRVFVSGTLTLGSGAAIARNGNNGNVSDGAGLSSGTLGESGHAGPGEGADGFPETNSLGGAGGNGAFTVGGTVSRPAGSAGGADVFRQALAALSGRDLSGAIVNGGGGGGGGLNTGEGGGGGGVVVVIARTIVGTSAAITANGGNAEAGIGAGGGGGGVVVVITASPQPAGVTISASGGSATSNGQDGAAGFTDWLN